MQLPFFVKEFNSNDWKENPRKRKQFLKSILRDEIPIGKTKEEIIDLFGMEKNIRNKNRWSYFLYKSKWPNRRTFVLAMYFKKDKVERIEVEYRYKIKYRIFWYLIIIRETEI